MSSCHSALVSCRKNSAGSASATYQYLDPPEEVLAMVQPPKGEAEEAEAAAEAAAEAEGAAPAEAEAAPAPE